MFCTFLSNILIITNPDISSIYDACTFIKLCSFGCITACSSGKNGMHQFKKLMLCMAVLELFYLGLSRGIVSHIYFIYSLAQIHCDTQCSSSGSFTGER